MEGRKTVRTSQRNLIPSVSLPERLRQIQKWFWSFYKVLNLLNITQNQSWRKFKRPMCIFQLLTSEYLISMLKLSLKWLFYLPKCWFNRPNARFGSIVRAPMFENWVLTLNYMWLYLCRCSVKTSLLSIHHGNSHIKTWATLHNQLIRCYTACRFCVCFLFGFVLFFKLILQESITHCFNFNCSFIIKTSVLEYNNWCEFEGKKAREQPCSYQK